MAIDESRAPKFRYLHIVQYSVHLENYSNSTSDILKRAVLEIERQDFETIAWDVFRLQSKHNLVYRDFLSLIEIDFRSITSLHDIPLLPISTFKHRTVQCGAWEPKVVFRSSGTSQTRRSNHFVKDLNFYQQLTHKAYLQATALSPFHTILALLPTYQSKMDSSLLAMIDHLMQECDPLYSEYITFEKLLDTRWLSRQCASNQKVVLWTIPLILEKIIERQISLPSNLIVIETGGMKGLKSEPPREFFHELFKKTTGVDQVWSEYGMSELFSQDYCFYDNYQPVPTLKMMPKRIDDPLSEPNFGTTSQIGCIDLANIDTCSFILSEDIGIVSENDTVKLLGRLDNADIRGCNLIFN